MKTKSNKVIQIIFILLLVEKIIQHALTALAFSIAIPGIGTPDIGTRFDISNPVMEISNLILAALFGCAILGIVTNRQWSRGLIFFLAVFDIAAEFIFHGLFFITISVLGAAILIILLLVYPIGKIPGAISP
jgi:hypothetical protein